MTDNTTASGEPAHEQGFSEGAHIVLRPVLERDLAELAPLLAQNPCEQKPTPWTLQRLKKKFEDEKEPGLWGRGERYYVAVRKGGGVAGFLRQSGQNRVFWITLHVDDAAHDRNELGIDILRAYEALMLAWHDPVRIGIAILSVEEDKADWLRDCGYEREVVFRRMQMWLGEPTDVHHWGWIAPAYRELAATQ